MNSNDSLVVLADGLVQTAKKSVNANCNEEQLKIEFEKSLENIKNRLNITSESK